MYLPARLISVPSGTTKADKCYRLSFDLFTTAVYRGSAGLARRRLVAVCLQSKRPDLYIEGENKRIKR